MTESDVEAIREAVESCTCSEMEYPFCEMFGCSDVKPLLADRERLMEALREIAYEVEGIPGFADRHKAEAQAMRRIARDLLDEMGGEDDG